MGRFNLDFAGWGIAVGVFVIVFGMILFPQWALEREHEEVCRGLERRLEVYLYCELDDECDQMISRHAVYETAVRYEQEGCGE